MGDNTKEKAKPSQDEDERLTWGSHIEFVLTVVACAVGLGNVWRFPHMAYSNGGGAFFIPYTISLFFMGIPLFFLEIFFGQFASLGPVAIWEINPFFKGLGFSMVFLSAFIAIYYNVIVAICFFFFFASMRSELQWASCGNEWNTCACMEAGGNSSLEDPMIWFDKAGLNCTGVINASSDLSLSSDEYFNNYVLELSSGLNEVGKLKLELVLCNLLGWVINCAVLIKGVYTLGKSVYPFAILPYIVLTALLIRGVTLEGASKGIEFYLKPDFSKLADSKVWKMAASQIFFSLSTCTGSLTAMASYNKFKNDVVRDSISVPIINCLTSFYAGIAIFSVLGFMSHNMKVPVSEVTAEGPGLAFVAYPLALSQMPASQLWSVLFFFMMITLGLGTQFPSIETVITGLQDEYKILRPRKVNYLFRIGVCLFLFLLGLPQLTQGGFYLVDLCDIFIGWPLIICGLLEIVAIVLVYSPQRFVEDVTLVVGDRKISMFIFNVYFKWTLVTLAPILLVAILVFDVVDYQPIYLDDAYPVWAEVLGWLIVVSTMIWVFIWFGITFWGSWKHPNHPPFGQVMQEINQPTVNWGPKPSEYRLLPRYGRRPSSFQKHLEEPEPAENAQPTESNEPVHSVVANILSLGMFSEEFDRLSTSV